MSTTQLNGKILNLQFQNTQSIAVLAHHFHNLIIFFQFWDILELNDPAKIIFSAKSFGENEPIKCTVINWKQVLIHNQILNQY